MTAPPTTLAHEEQIARFVLQRSWLRADRTVKQDAFVPPNDLRLTVTRHRGLTPPGLWSRGRDVAAERELTLHGRADLTVKSVRDADLDAVEHPLPANPQHAHVVGWAPDKATKKMAAQLLANSAGFVPLGDQMQ